MNIITKDWGSGLENSTGLLIFTSASGQVKISIFQVKIIFTPYIRPPDERGHWKFTFLISQPKHMLWVLKRTVSMRRFF